MTPSLVATVVAQIESAPSIAHVMVIANEFLQQLPSADLACLPTHAMPRILSHPDEVAAYAYILRATSAPPASESERMQQQIGIVMAAAAQKLAGLLAKRRAALGKLRG